MRDIEKSLIVPLEKNCCFKLLYLLALAVQVGLTKLFLLDPALLLMVSVALLLQLSPALLLHYHVGHDARLIEAFHLRHVVAFLLALGGAFLLGVIRGVALLVVLSLALAAQDKPKLQRCRSPPNLPVVFCVALLVKFGVAFIFQTSVTLFDLEQSFTLKYTYP